jgi:hypothetical protein
MMFNSCLTTSAIVASGQAPTVLPLKRLWHDSLTAVSLRHFLFGNGDSHNFRSRQAFPLKNRLIRQKSPFLSLFGVYQLPLKM